MKRYTLLRNNQETGPLLLHDLQELGLAATDLIWVEGESTCWRHPADVDGLAPLARNGIRRPLAQKPEPLREVPEYYGPSFAGATLPIAGNTAAPDPVEAYQTRLAAGEERFHWESKAERMRLARWTTSFFGLGVLLTGMLFAAFVVKKLVDHFDDEPQLLASEAVLVLPEQLNSQTSHAALAPSPASGASQVAAETTVQLLPQSQTAKAIEKKAPAKTLPLRQQTTKEPDVEELAANEKLSAVESAEATLNKQALEPAAPPKKTASLSLSANDYKVGVFGGVSNLVLTVSNPSPYAVEQAAVEVEFLKPNGSVVKTELLSVANLSAGGSKTLPVSNSNRGVKVRYRVANVVVKED